MDAPYLGRPGGTGVVRAVVSQLSHVAPVGVPVASRPDTDLPAGARHLVKAPRLDFPGFEFRLIAEILQQESEHFLRRSPASQHVLQVSRSAAQNQNGPSLDRIIGVKGFLALGDERSATSRSSVVSSAR